MTTVEKLQRGLNKGGEISHAEPYQMEPADED